MKEERTKKMLRFSSTTKETAFFSVLGKPHTSTLRKLWFERCRTNQHRLFEKDLIDFEAKGLTKENFFNREGATILNRAIISSISSKEFYYICQYIPKELIVQKLCADHCAILRMFMNGMAWLKSNERTDDLQEHCKKVELLLQLGSIEIENYLKVAVDEFQVGEEVKAHIKQVSMNSHLKLTM